MWLMIKCLHQAHFLLDKTLATTFSFPFTYCISKEIFLSNSTQQHCLQLKVDRVV